MHGNGTGVYQGMSERLGWPVQTFQGAEKQRDKVFEHFHVFF